MLLAPARPKTIPAANWAHSCSRQREAGESAPGAGVGGGGSLWGAGSSWEMLLARRVRRVWRRLLDPG